MTLLFLAWRLLSPSAYDNNNEGRSIFDPAIDQMRAEKWRLRNAPRNPRGAKTSRRILAPKKAPPTLERFAHFLVLMSLLLAAIAQAGEIRYVVATRHQFGTNDSHFLWRSFLAYDTCRRAMADAILKGGVKTVEDYNTHPNIAMFCEKGVVASMPPKIGSLSVGNQVELLDSKECATMVFVRALTGNLKGETGCVGAEALSSVKPK